MTEPEWSVAEDGKEWAVFHVELAGLNDHEYGDDYRKDSNNVVHGWRVAGRREGGHLPGDAKPWSLWLPLNWCVLCAAPA